MGNSEPIAFKAFPHRLIVEMVYDVTFSLNTFTNNDSVHEVMSPQAYT